MAAAPRPAQLPVKATMLVTLLGASLFAAVPGPRGAAAQAVPDHNPYERVEGVWGKLPEGRSWGATSAVFPAPDGRSMWVGERCGANSCAGADGVDPILQFGLDGTLLRSFGAGMILWPHGMFVDREGNVWVTDAVGFGQQPEGRGHVVLKFSPTGELLMTLGEQGVAGDGPNHFRQPSDVLVAPDGSIFVADGHGAGGNNRIVKLAADGSFLLQWGETGTADGQFRDPHALAMDSQGRLFVGDRGNSRTQIFDQQGRHLATWTQFGRPSGLFIDGNDVLYAADSESNTARNPGWQRGIYIGSARTGELSAFIPDPESDVDSGPGAPTSGAEGVAVDGAGNVYGAEVGPEMLVKYVRQPVGTELQALHEAGVTFRVFLDGVRARRALWQANAARAAVPAELLARAKAVRGSWRMLVVTVDDCSDSAHTLPYMAALADALPGVELRIVDPAAGRAVMEAHRTPDGRAATPTVVLLDAEGRVAGAWVERPDEIGTWFRENPEGLSEDDRHARRLAWYEADGGRSVMGELVALLEDAARVRLLQ